MAFLSDLGEMTSGKVDLVPEDELGYPDLDAILQTVEGDTVVFACGPPAMLAAVEERCSKYSRPEFFTWSASLRPRERQRRRSPPMRTPPRSELARQGVTITVPSDRRCSELSAT